MSNIPLSFLFTILPLLLFSQQKLIDGKVIPEYGKTYEIPNVDYKIDTSKKLKVLFDVTYQESDSTKVNSIIDSAARYLNMNHHAGMPLENMGAAMVFHGPAIDAILTNAEYKKKYGIDNPNAPLIAALNNKGAKFIICGQNAAYENITKENILPQVQFSISAMTALVQLQSEGYRLLNF